MKISAAAIVALAAATTTAMPVYDAILEDRSPSPESARPPPWGGGWVDSDDCTFSEMEWNQLNRCDGSASAKWRAMRCGISTKCSPDYTSTFGISNKERRQGGPPKSIDPSVGCENLQKNIQAFVDWLYSQYAQYGLKPSNAALDALSQTFQQAIALCGPMIGGGGLIPNPTIPGGPMIPDKPTPGGPMIPDKPNPGGPMIPDKPTPGGPMIPDKPSPGGPAVPDKPTTGGPMVPDKPSQGGAMNPDN